MTHHGAALRSETNDAVLIQAAHGAWRQAPISGRVRALFDYAERLTRAPSSLSKSDVDHLRATGLTDREILSLVEVIAYFNFVNRLAEGLGVALEHNDD